MTHAIFSLSTNSFEIFSGYSTSTKQRKRSASTCVASVSYTHLGCGRRDGSGQQQEDEFLHGSLFYQVSFEIDVAVERMQRFVRHPRRFAPRQGLRTVGSDGSTGLAEHGGSRRRRKRRGVVGHFDLRRIVVQAAAELTDGDPALGIRCV